MGPIEMEQSSMEKKKKLKSFNDLLPLELIREILLRVSIKHLACVRCVSKLWNTLISDPNFAKSHLDLSLAPSLTCLFLQDNSHAYSVDLDALLQDDNDGVDAIALSLPSMKKPSFDFHLLGSCRGFVLLQHEPQFLILWNPLTDSSKRISYSHMVNAATRDRDYDYLVKVFCFLHDALLCGFGYDASQDDYVVVVAYKDKDDKNHFDLCYLRSNSWISLDAALPKSLYWGYWKPEGLFCNGAIHWSTYEYCIDILIFDLKERSFSKISVPIETTDLYHPCLVLLGGCLALYFYEEITTEIWVMKEYKVQSSWTLYEIPLGFFQPLCLSANGDIIGRCYPSDGEVGFYIYNVRGELLKHVNVQYLYGDPNHIRSVVHVDCLMAVPSNIKQKKRKKGCQNHKEVKQGK
ncbi:F-box/kelch-repeat protein At3g06240-like [Arachis ipaensis]|uniref:F-box/kelch-repeat protein At3g06240-like n=1 Tax=Arachis ipaensis TaxID=130454 RepID=UPI000A2B660E|nr:F-box/kelch-repeat protein At3g06240-like [Arachis ipaensis]XP_025650252.1 F-box/kelch-repeat protein At3g06240-like [Arachis hypogaea]XP_025696978.1 F-box/kelch-repeat protein At3g06240-like [Arachis hypogaea]